MEQPWGLSGPEFLNIYWIALGISVLFAIGVRIRMRASRGDSPAGNVDVDGLAYLAGGPRRVVEASVARLIEVEALRSTRRGTVKLIGKPTAVNAVDRAVLADAGRYSNRTVSLLVPAVAQSDAVKAIATRLSEMRMLIEPATAKRELRVGALPMVVLFVIGVVRWVNGIAIGAPVGWLTLQLVITAVLVVLTTRSGSIQRTAAGDRALESARSGDWKRTAGVAAGGVAGLVALGGLSAHPDLALRTSLMYSAVGTSGGGGGYVSSGSGSSCGTAGSSCGGSGGGSSCGGGGGCGGGGS